jgi:hypothetical protein
LIGGFEMEKKGSDRISREWKGAALAPIRKTRNRVLFALLFVSFLFILTACAVFLEEN